MPITRVLGRAFLHLLLRSEQLALHIAASATQVNICVLVLAVDIRTPMRIFRVPPRATAWNTLVDSARFGHQRARRIVFCARTVALCAAVARCGHTWPK